MNTVQYEIQSDTLPNSPEIISVVSGKGGVGKTLTTIHLAFSWQNAGKEVLIVDGDLGLANIDVVLGLHPKRNISDVLERGATIEDVTLEGPFGVKILPAGSGITDLANLSNLKRHLLSSKLKKYLRNFDIVLVDNGAGINKNVTEFCKMSTRSLVLTTPEPHAITDAYAMIKVLKQSGIVHPLSLLVNMAKTTKEAENVFNRLAEVSMKFLSLKINFLGSIPIDQHLGQMVRRGAISRGQSIQTISGQGWRTIGETIIENSVKNTIECSFSHKNGNHLAFNY